MNYREEKPDIAVITLPHYLHKEAALFCADRGCHIMLEKPMAMNTRECDEIIDAVERNGIRMLVGYTQHYIAENIKARHLIGQGVLGELVMINDTRHVFYYREDRPAWFFEKSKAGGGILTNLGAHSVDKIQWLTGKKFCTVKANLSYNRTKGDVEGGGLVFLETADGTPATISQSGYPGVSQDVTELIFTKGMMRLKTWKSLEISEGGQYRKVEVEPVEPFDLQYRDLLESIELDREPSISLSYARSVVAVTDAIYRSHQDKTECRVNG